MGSNDITPPHVAAHTVPVSALLLSVGGGLWTVCYVLFVRESFRTKSYGMPLFAMAMNFSWEVVYALVTESPLDRGVFISWLVVDCGMVYGLVRFARFEWAHAPAVRAHIGWWFLLLTAGATAGHGAFAMWWIDNAIGQREGKFYRGVVGPDMTELGFWSALVCQLNLSVASLCQLVVRQHSGGVSWGIWATRTLGSIIGFYLNYGWCWYFWTEAHEYFMMPLAIFFWGTSLICDCVYPFVLLRVKSTEVVLGDGRKIAGGSVNEQPEKKAR